MDNDAENVKESEKYSFLLGSALRNEDPEQFLSVYDAILPDNLPDNQIEYIKDKAREIADLTEEDFNRLVSKAREFSLAQDREKMSRSSSTHISDEEDEDISHGPYGIHDMNYQPYPKACHSLSSRDHCIVNIENFEKRTDNDSGICNSSKATTSVGSYTDHEEDSDGDDRGCFDYFPSKTSHSYTRSSSSIKVTSTYHVDYDEAHEVESEKGSQNDIESPRSEISGSKDSDHEQLRGTEMTTFSRTLVNNEEGDFETSEESDNEVTFSCHKKMYGARRNENYYTPMTLENNEEYESTGTYSKFSFENSQRALKDGSASSFRKVDDPIAFPMYSRHSQSRFTSVYGSTSSDRGRIDKNVYSPTRETSDLVAGKDPPFGCGRDQLNKVGSSIGSLITGTEHTVDGMPEGRPITQTLDLASDDGKRKKKKRRSRDDLDDKTRSKGDYSSECDENGNPVERSPLLPNSYNYKQMRNPPCSGSTGKSKHSPGQSHEHNAYSSRLQHFNSNCSAPGQQLRDSDEGISQNNQETRKSRKKAKKDQGVRKSEDIENYVGNKDIDELLSFIENDGAGRKTKKLNHTNSSELPTTAKSTEKVNKKNKNPKITQEKGDLKVSDKIDKESDKETKEVDNSVRKTKVCATEKSEVQRVEFYVNIMGNSNGKPSSEENSVIDDCKSDILNDTSVKKSSEELENIFIRENSEISEKETILVQESKQNKDTKDKNKPTVDALDKKPLKNMDVNHRIESDAQTVNNVDKKQGKMSSVNKTESAVNSVKQNNIKNSKKKVIPPDGNGKQVENDKITNFKNGLVSMTNGPINSAPTVDFGDTNDLIQDNYYIFTDIETFKPVEEEFQVVGGKKKKKGSGGSSGGGGGGSGVSSSKEIPVKELPVPTKMPVKVENPRPQRSVTPPPISYQSCLATEMAKERVRDLSPSSFPALGSSRTGRDGRRSSTGDVPKDINIKPSDDNSDLESVKSLPASGQAVSPRLPVSYAKMAASPKPGGSSGTCSTAVSEEIVGKTDLKSTVWKGSLTERRHSIGSSPDGKECEVSPSLRQKSGSQEFIKTIDQEKISSLEINQLEIMIENPLVDGESEIVVISQNNVNLDSTDIPNSSNSTKHSVSDELDLKCEYVNLKMDNTKSYSSAKCSTSELPKENPSSDIVSNKNKVHKNQSCENQRNIKSPIPCKQSNKIPKSSVIFLDKQVEIPQDLGITFGFESFLDLEQSEACTSVADSVSNSSTDVSSNPSLTSPHTEHKSNTDKISSKQMSTNPVIRTVSKNQHSPESSSIVLDTKLIHTRNDTKTVNPLEGKNGIVRSVHSHVTNPEKQSSLSENISFGSEISFHADISEPAKISSDDNLFKGHNSDETLHRGSNYISVHFGDSKECSELLVSKDSINNVVPRPAGQLKFLVETGIKSDGFNALDVASYLKTEWDSVINLQERNPRCVITYSGQ